MTDSEIVIKKFSLDERRKTIRKFRKQAGLTLKQMADQCGLSESMLSLFETGKRDLSPEAFRRLENAVVNVLSGKVAAEEVQAKAAELQALRASAATRALRESAPGQFVQLKDLVGDRLEEKPGPPSFPLFPSLSSLASGTSIFGKTPLQAAEELNRHLKELTELQKRQIEGYRKMHANDQQIIALLTETGPGSVAVEATKVLDEVAKLRAENKELREWLNAEEVAAVAHDKAATLRERVSVAGMRAENAEEGE